MYNVFKCDLSIIIPVFNGQDSILRCLNSIYSIAWGDKSLEVIVIDDHSTDNTLQLLQSQERLRENLTIIQMPVNSKPGAARNRGIERASGQYLFFVDADDTVEREVVVALDYALNNNPDMLLCRMREQLVEGGGFVVKEIPLQKHFRYDGADFCEKYYDSSIHGAFTHYLISFSFIKRLDRPFAEGVVYEDLDWVEYHLYNCSSVEYDPSVIYSYWFTPTSILHSNGGPKDIDTLLFCFRRLQFANSVRHRSPIFFKKVFPIKEWVDKMLSFRRLSRYSYQDLLRLNNRLFPEAIPFFKSLKWQGFPGVYIKFPRFTTLFLSIIHPFSEAGRSFFHCLRH